MAAGVGWPFDPPGDGYKRDHLIPFVPVPRGIPAASKTPVYRLYNPYSGDHHYTTNAGEWDALAKTGWRKEGIGWFGVKVASSKPSDGGNAKPNTGGTTNNGGSGKPNAGSPNSSGGNGNGNANKPNTGTAPTESQTKALAEAKKHLSRG